ncbi:MAG: hypothetical protein K6G80_04600 [Treponema sp.]|nr:hypothetical protein [Treponema sp.]
MKKRLLAAFIASFLSFALFALPSGYDGIKLGMSVEEVKSELKKHAEFGYRGDRDVSLSPSVRGQKNGEKVYDVLIETDATYAPLSFFDRCWFQFTDGKLSTITLNLNREKVDHYSVFQTLCEKYGDPQEISPQKSVWTDSSVQLSLERPLVLKYVDRKIFDQRREDSNVEKTTTEKMRDDFLERL